MFLKAISVFILSVYLLISVGINISMHHCHCCNESTFSVTEDVEACCSNIIEIDENSSQFKNNCCINLVKHLKLNKFHSSTNHILNYIANSFTILNNNICNCISEPYELYISKNLYSYKIRCVNSDLIYFIEQLRL